MNLKFVHYSLICLIALLPLPAQAFLSNPIVAGWLPVSWDEDVARASFRDNIDVFDEISPFQYNLLEDGTLGLYENAEDPTLVTLAHEHGVKVLPTITNNFSGEKVHNFVHDPVKRTALVQEIIQKIEANAYDGIDIDFEGYNITDKEDFVVFIRELALELHSRNKILSIAIQARTPETHPSATSWSQDWEAIGQLVDRFRIMTYDYHWQSSNAGSVAPVKWINEVATYAEARVPHEKIIMGIPFYGYNWPCAPGNWNDCGRGIGVTHDLAQGWIEDYDVPLGWDSENEEPYFTYMKNEPYGSSPTTERIVYFQNAASIHSKLLSFADNRVNGIAIWRLGQEDPGNYESIRLGMGVSIVSDFLDVSPEHWAYAFIQPLKSRGIVQGIDNQFFPDRTITRAETIKMTLGNLKLPKLTYQETPVTDVRKSEWAYDYIQTALLRKWMIVQEGTVRPHATITRGEAVTVLMRAMNEPSRVESRENFSDVGSDNTHAVNIATAVGLGWVNGYDDGTFRPNQPITRAEFAKLLARASGV